MIDAVLITETGEEIQRVLDHNDILTSMLPPRDSELYPFLSSINPYGNTVFNSFQTPRLFQEWEFLENQARDGHEREFLAAVKELIRLCNGDYHGYLKFEGE